MESTSYPEARNVSTRIAIIRLSVIRMNAAINMFFVLILFISVALDTLYFHKSCEALPHIFNHLLATTNGAEEIAPRSLDEQ